MNTGPHPEGLSLPTLCATLHRIPIRGAPSPPGRGVLHYLEIILSNIQIVDLPALPEVEEVCLSDIEDELLLSRHFCNFAWLFLASNNAQVSALA
ncbi:hypothetical protein PANN_54070 [Pseudomonas aeruginosa C-NN2]|nr:hypothetical protein PANN_54070 [Pseudomonas aeruginosa C-NN2]